MLVCIVVVVLFVLVWKEALVGIGETVDSVRENKRRKEEERKSEEARLSRMSEEQINAERKQKKEKKREDLKIAIISAVVVFAFFFLVTSVIAGFRYSEMLPFILGFPSVIAAIAFILLALS